MLSEKLSSDNFSPSANSVAYVSTGRAWSYNSGHFLKEKIEKNVRLIF